MENIVAVGHIDQGMWSYIAIGNGLIIWIIKCGCVSQQGIIMMAGGAGYHDEYEEDANECNEIHFANILKKGKW